MKKTMLTTIDNPFDPFTQFNEWYSFDESKGYHTCSYLARIAIMDDDVSEEKENIIREKAIDEIVELNVIGLYKKVTIEV